MSKSEVRTGDADHGSAGGDGGPAAAVEARLLAIVDGLHGCNVASLGDEIWFGLESGGELEIRLCANRDARCFDRSASFAISYGGQPSDAPVSPLFLTALARIKAIDAVPLQGLATAFGPAAEAVVRQRSSGEPADVPAEAAPAPALTTPQPLASETPEQRALNVIFLDYTAQLAGRPADGLMALHFGFWPTGAATAEDTPNGFDPCLAYSEELLAHIPAGVTRVLDVGCGLGFNEPLLSARGMQVTAVSPVPHHCAVVENARLPNVEVRCARFEDMVPDAPYDLLLFSESVNHFALHAEFLRHCASFLTDTGYMLMANDLNPERVRQIEEQQEFRVIGKWDITENVAPSIDSFVRRLQAHAAQHRALMAVLDLYDPPVAARVRAIIDALEHPEIKALFSGDQTPPPTLGRYLIYLLQRR